MKGHLVGVHFPVKIPVGPLHVDLFGDILQLHLYQHTIDGAVESLVGRKTAEFADWMPPGIMALPGVGGPNPSDGGGGGVSRGDARCACT